MEKLKAAILDIRHHLITPHDGQEDKQVQKIANSDSK